MQKESANSLRSIFLLEAKRLYDLGFGVHWIRPKSKAPVQKGWADGVRQTWDELERSYREGYGLGCRLGAASQLPDGTYLGNIDIDIKSKDLAHKREALEFVAREFPGLLDKAPTVTTGYGLRLFFRSKEPLQSKKISASNEKVKTYMPTADSTSREQQNAVAQGILTKSELTEGYRIRTAWEVELMSAGRQVVLPPTIHPDTGKPYLWTMPLGAVEAIPLYSGNDPAAEKPVGVVLKAPAADLGEWVDVDLADKRFTSSMLKQIKGEGVLDRSATMFGLAISMLKQGFSEVEVVSLLTDKRQFIGEAAFEHRKTKERKNAADWVKRYVLEKAKAEASAKCFEGVAETPPALSVEQAEAQAVILLGGENRARTPEKPWQSLITRGGRDGQGPIKPTALNVVLLLENLIAPNIFRRDTFAGGRETYGVDAPWTGAKAGKALEDCDAVAVKVWLSQRFGFEPPTSIVNDAISEICGKNLYSSAADELMALKPWDGKPRLYGWLKDHFEAEGPAEYLGQVFSKWLVASVTRVFEPGAKFDWLPIFEGPQGVGKSSFGEILFGQRHFADWLPNLADKDAALGLLGRRCVEFGELDRLRRNEMETIKAFLTRRVDVLRPPYGRRSIEYPRQTVFFGTTNSSQFLKDTTGNRRFLPVKVGRLNFKQLEMDREQLWAEALAAYELGLEPELYLTGAAADFAKEIQAEKMVEDDSDVMAELIFEFMDAEKLKPEDEKFNFEKFKIKQLFETMGPLREYRYEQRNLNLAGAALRKLGFKRIKTKKENFWAKQSPSG